MTQPVPIIDVLLHPPLGFLRRELIPGLFSGSGDLTRNDGRLPPFNNVNAYGLTWTFFTVPDTLGVEFGNPNVYEERMLQLSAMHIGQDGHELVSEFHSFAVEGVYWLWENVGPARIHYDIRIGVELTFFWLIIAPF